MEVLVIELMIPVPIVMEEDRTEESFVVEVTLVGVVPEFGAALVGISQPKRVVWASARVRLPSETTTESIS
jgi:hypothetical protein